MKPGVTSHRHGTGAYVGHGGFVGFGGFTNRQSTRQRFAHDASLPPTETHTNSNLKYPKSTTYKAYKLVFFGGFVGSSFQVFQVLKVHSPRYVTPSHQHPPSAQQKPTIPDTESAPATQRKPAPGLAVHPGVTIDKFNTLSGQARRGLDSAPWVLATFRSA